MTNNTDSQPNKIFNTYKFIDFSEVYDYPGVFNPPFRKSALKRPQQQFYIFDAEFNKSTQHPRELFRGNESFSERIRRENRNCVSDSYFIEKSLSHILQYSLY
jgi:hypothetical protein